MNRLELLSFFEKRDIETRHIPPDVLERARKVVERIEGGESYLSVHGKRLVLNHRRISIPLGRKWRLLADAQGTMRRRCPSILPRGHVTPDIRFIYYFCIGEKAWNT